MYRKIYLLLTLLLALPIGMLADKKPVKVGLTDIAAARHQRVTRAADKEGVKATLKYEKVADMLTPRMAHQIFPSGNGLVVVGGRTTGFKLTKTAELYQNGTWTSLSIGNYHDGAFSVKMSDGRYMVGGGFSSAGGVGQSRGTDIYDPQTRTFTTGLQLTSARAQSKAISIGSQIYVSGNWYANDPTMDYYDGSAFNAVGETDGRSNPYMMVNGKDEVFIFSAYDTQGQSFGFYTDTDGDVLLLADRYTPSTGVTRYFGLPFTQQSCPLALPDDARPADLHYTWNGDNCYLILARTTDGYMLYLIDIDEPQIYRFNTFGIPTKDDAGQDITWRGSVIINESRQEAYLIGTSGAVTNQTLHVISLNYNTDEWTIASAPGFRHNLLTASWTLMADGRLACTGGGIKDNTDAQPTVYLVTPPTAGRGDDDTPGDDTENSTALVVTTKNGMQTTFVLLKEKPQARFVGPNLNVTTSNGVVSFALTDVQRFNYINLPATGIQEIKDTPDTDISYEDGSLVLSQLKEGTQVGVYTLDGKLVRQLKAQHTGTFRLNLSALPSGVYVVKAGTLTYKIMKP